MANIFKNFDIERDFSLTMLIPSVRYISSREQLEDIKPNY